MFCGLVPLVRLMQAGRFDLAKRHKELNRLMIAE